MDVLHEIRVSILGTDDAGFVEWLGPGVGPLAARGVAESLPPERLLTLGDARRELDTVAELMRVVDAKDRELRAGRNLADLAVYVRAFDQFRDEGPAETLRFLFELRTRAYGKVLLLRDATTGDFRALRIAQANYGFPELGVINRQSVVARRLVHAEIGEEVEIGPKQYEVVGIAHLERHHGNALLRHADDFAHMALLRSEATAIVDLYDLRETFARECDALRELLRGAAAPEPDTRRPPPVVRGEHERLGAQFYTRTTKSQETLMQGPSSGLAVVIGIAGSGKTSVALGRTKVLCDRTQEQDEDDPTFFRSETAVGFVLSAQLCTYLERAAQQLALFGMPIREYRDLRESLFTHRQLESGGWERKPSEGNGAEALEGSMAWLGALDVAIADVLAERLAESVASPPGERDVVGGRRRAGGAARTDAQNAALADLFVSFSRRVVAIADRMRQPTTSKPFRIERVALALDDARAELSATLEADEAWRGPENRELRQNIRSVVRERIVRALRVTDAYAKALASERFTSELRVRVGDARNVDIDAVVTAARARTEQKKLTESDIDALLSVGHLISLGYRGRDDRDPISHLAETSFYSQVFIDEFQDFSEVQLFLMSEQADPRRRAVTVVGDPHQRLMAGASVEVKRAFPRADEGERTPTFLHENKRQTVALAELSRRFRCDVLGEATPEPSLPAGKEGRARLVLATHDELADILFDEIIATDRSDSIAVICPSALIARTLESELHNSLEEKNRPSRVSQHGDLTRRFLVHFTTALDAKGLEFDGVIVPRINAFDLQNAVMANACYVALSRPRRSLVLIADGELDARWTGALGPALARADATT